MFHNVLRDAELVEPLRPTLAPLQAYLAETVTILTAGWPTRKRRRPILDAALHHAVDFQTWRSLTTNDRITRSEAVELTVALVERAAGC